MDGVESGVADIYPDPFAVELGRQYEASPKTSEEQLAALVQEA